MLGRRQQKELEKQQLQLAIQKHKLQQRRLAAQLAAQGRLLAQQQAQLDAMQRGGGEVSPHTLYERGGGYEIGLLASTGRATPCPAGSMLLQRPGARGTPASAAPLSVVLGGSKHSWTLCCGVGVKPATSGYYACLASTLD